MSNKHERAQTHDFPTKDELDHVLGYNHVEHACREQRERCKEMCIPTVTAKVFE